MAISLASLRTTSVLTPPRILIHGVAEGGAPLLVRVVARRADAVTDFGDARIWSETTRVDLQVAEVPEPRPGDRIEIEGEAFLFQGEPVRDRERLVWTVDLRPA